MLLEGVGWFWVFGWIVDWGWEKYELEWVECVYVKG